MAAKATPPLTVVGVKLAGMPVADWVQWATLIYVLMMIGHKGWHIYKEWKTGRETSDDA